jgi:hypothetical protein
VERLVALGEVALEVGLEHGWRSSRLASDRRESRAASEPVRAADLYRWYVDRDVAEGDLGVVVVGLGRVVGTAVVLGLVSGSIDELFGLNAFERVALALLLLGWHVVVVVRVTGFCEFRHDVAVVVEHLDLDCDDALLQVVGEVALRAAELEVLAHGAGRLVLREAIARCCSGTFRVRLDVDVRVRGNELSNRE